MKGKNEMMSLDFEIIEREIKVALKSENPDDVRTSLYHLELAMQTEMCTQQFYRNHLDLLSIVYSMHNGNFHELHHQVRLEAEDHIKLLIQEQTNVRNTETSKPMIHERGIKDIGPRSYGETLSRSRMFRQAPPKEPLDFESFKNDLMSSDAYKKMIVQLDLLQARVKNGTAPEIEVVKHTSLSLLRYSIESMKTMQDWENIKLTQFNKDSMDQIYPRSGEFIKTGSASKTWERVDKLIKFAERLELQKYRELFSHDNSKSLISRQGNNTNYGPEDHDDTNSMTKV